MINPLGEIPSSFQTLFYKFVMMSKALKKLLKDNQQILEYLEKSRLFGHLPRELLEKLVPLSEIVNAPQGTQLLLEGQINDQVFFLIRGEVAVYAAGELLFKLRRIGDIFGEMSVISDKPCSATVIAVTPVSLFSLRSRDVGEYSDLNSEDLQNILYRIFAMILTEKLSLTTNKAKQFEATNRTLQHTQQRLEKTYHELKKKTEELQQSLSIQEMLNNNLMQTSWELNETKMQLESSYAGLEQINNAFRLFVPKQFLDRIHEEIDTLPAAFRPGHLYKEEEMTVLFSDIRAFTTVAEQMSSEETFDFLNTYLAFMEPCITQNNGFIDKFIGDAIMAIFPTAEEAVHAALAMGKAVRSFNQQRLEQEKPLINVGIGINTGPVMIGLLGTNIRLESTVIGDTVNLASRLEGLTKHYGIQILISEETYSRLTLRKHVRIIDRVLVRGREAPLSVYEVFGGECPEVVQQKESAQEQFEAGFLLYLQNLFQEALVLFRTCSQIYPSDLMVRMYIFRCTFLLNNPPPKDWEGIFQKRATRYDLGDISGRLFFRFSCHQEAPMPILVRNISKTGALIIIEHHHELYDGENLIVNIPFQPHTLEDYSYQATSKLAGQVRRREPGPILNQHFTLKFGLEFTEITREQNQFLQKTLADLSQENPDPVPCPLLLQR